MLTEIFVFLRAVVSHWQGLVTGGIITALVSLIERLTPWRLSTRAFVGLFLGGYLIVAFFGTWRDQYRTALRVPALEQQLKDNEKTILDLKSHLAQVNASPMIVNIPASPQPARSQHSSSCRTLSACPNDELKRRSVRLAADIERLYTDSTKETDRIQEQLRSDPRYPDSLSIRHMYDFRYAAAEKMAVQRYDTLYHTDALRYREELLLRVGPGLHDKSMDYKYTPRPTFADSLRDVAQDLRTLASNL
jgi:hypothetical protein